MTTSDSRIALLDEAKRIVCGDRDQEYGAPEDNFALIAAKWSVTLSKRLKSAIEPHEVAVMMIDLKTIRCIELPTKPDSWTDTAGYSACGWACVKFKDDGG
jgi:hypothetical protein